MLLQGTVSSVIEYMQGGSLRAGLKRLQSDNKATERFRAAIALQAARGVWSVIYNPERYRIGAAPMGFTLCL